MKEKLLIIRATPASRRNLWHETLQTVGYQLSEADPDTQALTLLDVCFDLVLMEIQPGAIPDIVLLKFIRQQYAECPLILLSAIADKATVSEALREVADDCLYLPLDPEELLRVVKHWLSYSFLKKQNACLPENQAAVESLQASDEKYRLLMQSAGDAIFIADAQTGILLDVNRSAEILTGRKREELMGMQQSELHPPDETDNYRELFANHVKSGGSLVAASVFVMHQDGRRIPVEINSVVADFADRKVILGVFRDITRRIQDEQELRQSELKYKAILEASPMPLGISDDQGNITYLNKAFIQTTGYSLQDIPTLTDWWPLAYPDIEYRQQVIEAWQTRLQQVKQGDNDFVPMEVSINCKNGSKRIFMVGASSLQQSQEGNHLVELYDITERKRVETAIVESNNLLQNIINAAPMRIFWKNRESRFLGCNPAFARDAGVQSPQHVIGKFDNQLGWKDQAEMYRADDLHVMEQEVTKLGYEEPQTTPDGDVIWLSTSKVPLRDASNEVIGMVGIYQDITARKKAETELKIAATAFEANVGIMVADAMAVIVKVNRAFTEHCGYSAEELIGQTPSLLKSNRHDSAFFAAMWDSLKRNGTWEGEIWDRRKNGEIYPKWQSITEIRGDDGAVSHYVSTQTDITDRKMSEDAIKTLAFYDPLTSLPNRRLLKDRLQQAIVSSKRSGQSAALLFLDLDHFKVINDTLGHIMGDSLLQEVAQRLTSCVRDKDTVARLGGDEFVVMLEELGRETIEAATQAEVIAEKIIIALNCPYQLGAQEYHNTPSIGITLFKEHEIEIEELFKQADIAMYQAKKAGRNTLRFFDPQMQLTINSRAALESELRKALERQQLHLYYQLQLDESNRPEGAEALIRWQHPERGLVSPAQFIPLAEESGLILPIGKWVLEMACRQLREWQKREMNRELTLSINVSARQFRQDDFVSLVQSVVQQYDIKPGRLKLEITESMLLENMDKIVEAMNLLKAVGVSLSLDDFGTGYSSLQYLKQLPLDQLKIDQSFVRDLAVDDNDKAIVTTIIAMAHGLNLEVIAEGVETEQQREYLLSAGCRHYQGYLFGKPMPIDQFNRQLEGY